MTAPLLCATILVSRDGLDDLPVALTGHVEPGSRAKDGSCVVVVESAVWEDDVSHEEEDGPVIDFWWGEPVTLTDAETKDAEEALFLTL